METLSRDRRSAAPSPGWRRPECGDPVMDRGESVAHLDFAAQIRRGPNAGTTYCGRLRLPISRDGAIEHGSWFAAGAGGATNDIPVIGTVIGSAINLLIVVGCGGIVYATGMLDRSAGEAAGTYRGQCVGPEADDLGAWTGSILSPGGCRSAADPRGAAGVTMSLVSG